MEVTGKENEKEKSKEEQTANSSSSGKPSSSGNASYSNTSHNGARSKGNMQTTSQSLPQTEKPKLGAMEVFVEHNIEKAMKILKRKLIKEGLFKELKSRRYYEKPSERKKRKHKESLKKARKEEARQKKNPLLFS